MKIYEISGERLKRLTSLIQALKISTIDRRIAFVGAGGKTTLMFALAEELCQRRKHVIVTTSTHIREPEGFFLTDSDGAGVESVWEKGKIAVLGTRAGEGKISAPAQNFFEVMAKRADVVLVEADGSRGLPIKVPAVYEPVLSAKENLVVGVAGIDAWGQPLEKCCHRAELAAAVLGKNLQDKITADDFAKLLQSAQGMRKAVQCRFVPVLHKINTPEQMKQAKAVANCMGERILAIGRG
jgi:probable selenium-dependent hydroxylase accessory protein YqeC